MRAIQLPGALADPQEMGRAVVPVAGCRFTSGQGLFVTQQQRLVRSVELDLAHLGIGGGVQSASAYESQRLADAVGQIPVARALGTGAQKIEIPLLDPVQIGETTWASAAAGSALPPTGHRRATVGVGRAAAHPE